MCFKPKVQAAEMPAQAPDAPQASPTPQDIGGVRKNENIALYGTATGPKTKRSSRTAGIATPSGQPGLKM